MTLDTQTYLWGGTKNSEEDLTRFLTHRCDMSRQSAQVQLVTQTTPGEEDIPCCEASMSAKQADTPYLQMIDISVAFLFIYQHGHQLQGSLTTFYEVQRPVFVCYKNTEPTNCAHSKCCFLLHLTHVNIISEGFKGFHLLFCSSYEFIFVSFSTHKCSSTHWGIHSFIASFRGWVCDGDIPPHHLFHNTTVAEVVARSYLMMPTWKSSSCRVFQEPDRKTRHQASALALVSRSSVLPVWKDSACLSQLAPNGGVLMMFPPACMVSLCPESRP